MTAHRSSTATAGLLGDDDWKRDAACRGARTTEFFPERDHEAAAYAIRRWCESCPVIAACHLDAERHRDWGVRGGLLRVGQTTSDPRAYTAAELEAGSAAAGRPPKALDGGPTRRGPRGYCKVCRRSRGLTSDGRVRVHTELNGSGTCAGSSYRPEVHAS